MTANGENGNVPVAPIISRHDWSTDISLVGHNAPIEVAVSLNGNRTYNEPRIHFLCLQCFNPITWEIEMPPDQDPSAPPIKVKSAICAIAGQDKGISVWWTARSHCAASTQNLFKHSVHDLSW